MITKVQIILFCLALAGMSSCKSGYEKSASPEEGEFRLGKLHYENSAGEKGITHFYYDPDGQNYLAVWQLEDSSRSSLNRHTFDSSGRMILKYREFSDGITSIQHFYYDMGGNLVREDFSRSDSIMGQVEYVYGEYGQVEYAECQGLNGWFYGRLNYTWENGVKTGAEIIMDSQNAGSVAYEYEDGLLVSEEWDFNGKWSQTFRYAYQQATLKTYTSSNAFIHESPWFRVKEEYYEYNSESGGPSHYVYDSDGSLINKEFIRSDGLSTNTSYDFDSTGLLDHSLREYGDGRTCDFLYWFNVDRKMLVKTFQCSDGSSGSETYRFKDGVMVKGEYVNVDGWLSGTLNFIYNDSGVFTSADYSGEDGSEAGIIFSYDRNFNLVQIHWEFALGPTQTYYFTYESPVTNYGNIYSNQE